MTTWRPYLEGMATTAEAIDVDLPNAVGLTLQCLATSGGGAGSGGLAQGGACLYGMLLDQVGEVIKLARPRESVVLWQALEA